VFEHLNAALLFTALAFTSSLAALF